MVRPRGYTGGVDQALRELHRELSASPGDAELVARYHGLLARVHSGSALALLRDREAWQRADPILQDAAIVLVGNGLGDAWEWIETSRYACGGQEHRIAAFLLRPLDIRFHLLPGGHTLRGTADPLAEAAYWEALSDGRERLFPITVRAYRGETPTHEITIPPLLVSQTPLTREQFERRPPPPGWTTPETWFGERLPGPLQPVHGTDPLVFDGWLRGKEEYRLRLLSEAEWEYACRAGTTTRFFWGDTFEPDRCWYEDNSEKHAHPATAHAEWTNAFGLVDMLGNVRELCRDTFDDDHYRDRDEILNEEGYPDARYDHRPVVIEGQRGRILRGGSAWSQPSECRSAARYRLHGSTIMYMCGRLARSLPALTDLVQASPPPRTFQALRTELVFGDIALAATEAVANAANDQLAMGGGVAGALHAAGGLEIEREAVRSAPAAIGSVVRTGAGDLMARFVYHAVVIRYDLKGGTRAPDVRVAVRGLLEAAAEDGVSSLALPLFGAGVGGLSLATSIETILDSLEEHAGLAPGLRVEIRACDQSEFEEAREAWQRYQGRAHREGQVDRAAEDYMRRLRRERAGDEDGGA